MITIKKEIQSEIVFMEMNEMVPKESIFRKIDKYIDFTFIILQCVTCNEQVIKKPLAKLVGVKMLQAK